MTDHAIRRAVVVLGRVAQFTLAALAGALTLAGLMGGTNVLVAGAFALFALVLLAFAAVVEWGVRWARPSGE